MLYQKTENAFLSVLDKTENGTFTFENPGGKIYDFAGKHAGPHGHLKLHAPDVLWNMAIGGDTALAGDYRTGKWDREDSSPPHLPSSSYTFHDHNIQQEEKSIL